MSFWVWKSLLIYAYKCSKYLEYINPHLEVHSEVFQSIVLVRKILACLEIRKAC